MKVQKTKINKKLYVLILAVVLILAFDAVFYYYIALLDDGVSKSVSKMQEAFSKGEKEYIRIEKINSEIEALKQCEKDELPDKTLLVNLMLLTKFIGKNNIISIQPDIKRIADDNKLIKIPIKIEFKTNFTSLIDIFKKFSQEYPEPKFENVQIEYVNNSMNVKVDFISVSRKIDELDREKIRRVFSSINKVKNPIGFFYDYNKAVNQLSAQTGAAQNQQGAAAPSGISGNTGLIPQAVNPAGSPGSLPKPQNQGTAKKKVKVKVEYNDIKQPEKTSAPDTKQTNTQTQKPAEVKKPVTAPVTFRFPVEGAMAVLHKFGEKITEGNIQVDFHNGIDIPGKTGTPVFAADNGKLIFVGELDRKLKNIILEGTSGKKYKFVYSNLETAVYPQGKTVKKGQKIGTIGKDSLTGEEYLHFGVMLEGKFEDPLNLKYAGVK